MTSDIRMNDRRFFHSFPRPKKGEPEGSTLERGLAALDLMKKVGPILAPEIVNWDISGFSLGAKQLGILQRRMSFTELATSELPEHSKVFGPISLAFDLAALRAAGAIPVIYVPQGVVDSPLSLIATFCVHGIHHTKGVLSQLQQLKETADPVQLGQRLNMPVDPNCELQLKNRDSGGNIVAEYKIRLTDVQHVLQYIGFNNIPFDHSAGILGYFLDIFYPTDNTYKGDQLGYYRQREWRLIVTNINVRGRPIGRKLSASEVTELEKVDLEFWSRKLSVDGVDQKRSELALVYDPTPSWNLFDVVEEVLVPADAVDRARAIVGNSVSVGPAAAEQSSAI